MITNLLINFKKLLLTNLYLIITLLFRIISVAGTFLLNIYLSRKYGADLSGAYYLVYNYIAVLVSIVLMGLNNAIVHNLTPLYSQDKYEEANYILFKSVKIIFYISLALGFIIYIFNNEIARYILHKNNMGNFVQLISIAIFPACIVNMYGELFKALKKPNQSIVVQNILANSLFFVLILFNKQMSQSVLVENYIIALYISFLLLAAYQFCRFRKIHPVIHLPNNIKYELKEKFRFFWRENIVLMSINISNTILSVFDSLIIGTYLKVSDVAIYNVAGKCTSTGGILLTVLNSVIGFRIAELSYRKERDKLRTLMVYYTKMMFIVGVLYLAFMQFFAPFIPAFFSNDFERSIILVRILAIGQFIVLATGPGAQILIMSGHAADYRRITILSAIVCIILDILLVPKFGLIGASICNITTLSVKNIWGFMLVKKQLKVSWRMLFNEKL